MRLSNRVAVITGAKGGIGLATAGRFAAEGAGVVLVDVLDASAEARMLIESGSKARFIRVDVGDEAEVAALFTEVEEEFGRVDVLVNNATVESADSVLSSAGDAWDELMSVNLRGAFLCAKAAIPSMERSGGGSIVNMSSELALISSPGPAAYSTSKAALVQLTRVLAADHAKANIRVNALCPGPISTQLLQEVLSASSDPGRLLKSFEERTLLGRLGRPEEVASACAYLASDDSSYMTGATLVLDGGWTAH
jgi:meso-butanediol dehydrogenase / (S,S)-butanediol dehydrogenase / diacetyl reductase